MGHHETGIHLQGVFKFDAGLPCPALLSQRKAVLEISIPSHVQRSDRIHQRVFGGRGYLFQTLIDFQLLKLVGFVAELAVRHTEGVVSGSIIMEEVTRSATRLDRAGPVPTSSKNTPPA